VRLLLMEEEKRSLLGALGGVFLFVVLSAVGVVISAGFVSLAGRAVSGDWQYVATVVGFAFLDGLVRWVTAALILLSVVGVLPWGAGPALLIFFWAWLLKLLVIQGIFGYGMGAALLINLLAGALQMLAGVAFLGSAIP
jgi:hypothetical protein